MSNNYSGSGGDSRRGGGGGGQYHQKRGGAGNQQQYQQHHQPGSGGASHHGKGEKGRNTDGSNSGTSQQHQQQVYVKKASKKEQQDKQQFEEEKNLQQQQQQQTNNNAFGDQDESGEIGSGLTAAQKFDLMFSSMGTGMGGAMSMPSTNQQQESTQVIQEEVKQQQQKQQTPITSSPSLRKVYAKDYLLTKFVKTQDLNLSFFEKDVLQWIDVFSSNSQEPEAATSTDQRSQNAQLQSVPQQKRPPMPGNKYQKGGADGGGQSSWNRGGAPKVGEALEDDEDEEDPEWVHFDPKKESSSFFGRAIVNEQELREKAQKDRNQLQAWTGSKMRKQSQEDEFEKLIREEQASQRKALDKDLEQKVDVLANDLERNERNFSDIDMIFEKNAKQKRQQQTLDDQQLEDLFNSLMEEETKKKETPSQKVEVKKEAPVQQVQQQQQQQNQQQQQQQPQPKVELPQNIQQQIKNLSIQQKQQIQAQKLVVPQKPKFTALQNIQNLFSNLPVVTYEKHRINMDQIAKIETEQDHKEDLFKQLMASINPFSKYVIEEGQQGSQSQDDNKFWKLEDSIFQKPASEVKEDTLKKTSSEMFVINKYFSDPLIKVKSEKYTEDKFIQIKDLFPSVNLLQTSVLNLQLQQIPMMMNQMPPQMGGNMSGFMQGPNLFMPMQFQPQPQQQQPSAQKNSQQTDNQQQTIAQQQLSDLLASQVKNPPQTDQQQQQQQQQRELQKAPQQYISQQILQSLDDELEQDNEEEQMPKNDLSNMESQLKSLLGFNPR